MIFFWLWVLSCLPNNFFKRSSPKWSSSITKSFVVIFLSVRGSVWGRSRTDPRKVVVVRFTSLLKLHFMSLTTFRIYRNNLSAFLANNKPKQTNTQMEETINILITIYEWNQNRTFQCNARIVKKWSWILTTKTSEVLITKNEHKINLKSL